MTKMHFEEAALIVRSMRSPGRRNDTMKANAAQEAFIQLFQKFNPKFDSMRFAEACAYPAPKGKR